MPVRKKKELTIGILLFAGFIGVLIIMFLPIWGAYKENFLSYADRMFNSLAKGSAYYIPKVQPLVEKFKGTPVDITIKEEKADPEICKKIYTMAGAQIEIGEKGKIHIKGDLGQILTAALEDSENMYWNRGDVIKEKYGVKNEKAILKNWHMTLERIEREYKLAKKVEELQVITQVKTKALEPAYNFYGVIPEKVQKHAILMTALFVFYIIYTIWYGFSMLYLFEGFGLSTKKPKVKKEV